MNKGACCFRWLTRNKALPRGHSEYHVPPPIRILFLAAALIVFLPEFASAQTETGTESEAPTESASEENLLTAEELQNLVAPVALYPDTLLIQIAVASTVPLDVMKADRFLKDNIDRDPAELEADIEAQGWDPSVQVLATAFPVIIGEMATHVDWTETMGTAMLAQSEDVMEAVQVMRDSAINSGALVSGPQQTVEEVDDQVVITPTDPDVVYVPDYTPSVVYGGPSTGDIIGATLLTFGTVAIIDSIFDDDDDWNDYWGCRNCGGWGGGPIIRDPDIDIDIDGNVNIGNDIDLGDRTDIGWKPDPDRAQDAKDKIGNRQRPDGRPSKLPVSRPEGRTNELRNQLSERSGAPDISRDLGGAAAVGAGAGAGAALASRGDLPKIGGGGKAADKAAAVKATKARPSVKKPAVKAKPKTSKKPTAKKKAASASKSKAKPKKSALNKKSSGKRAKSAGNRGKKSKGKKRR